VDENSTVTRMLSWVDSLPAEQRFFITYLPIAGHHPYDTPEAGPFAEDQEFGRYLNALHYGDKILGHFLLGLQVRGLDEKTLFVIFGDHGEAFGQHEGNYGHTLFIFDENIHVPLLIAAPGLIKKQIPVNRIASLIDTAPTICDLLGLPSADTCQGNSLLKPNHQMALFVTDYSLGYLGLRDGPWKFIHELESGRSKLFDVSLDPEEKMNRASQFPALVSKYKDRLRRWGAAQKDLIARRARENGKEEETVVSSVRTRINANDVLR
jgi:lipoteichoic acid synthase